MTDYFPLILSFVKDAGEIALRLIDQSHPEIKADRSVITDADRRISALAHERLAPLLSTGQHVLVDEEDPRRGEYLNKDVLERAPYLWALDPIDATRAYANRMPHYGISLGLLKNCKPWMGAVYFPSLRELFCCDGDRAFFIEDPFTSQEKRTEIVPVDEEISRRSLFIATENILDRFEWRSDDCCVMILSAAVCELCWPTIGRGCGSLFKANLWDMAGSWPILQRAGLKIFSFSTGEPLEKIDMSLFEGAPAWWKLKAHYILCSPGNFPLLKNRLTLKKERGLP